MSSQLSGLSGHTALVTGAASGIGRAVAGRLATDGATVLLLDRDERGVQEAAAELGAEPLVADLSDPSSIDALNLADRGIDVLVNNAGIQHVAPIEEFDPERFAQIHQVMLQAPFLLTRAVLPGMYAAGWGRIVHLSSVHGHRASPYKSAYVSAKHGLEGLSKVIALEAAGKGVTSNTVCPGYVRTPLVEGQIADQATQPRHRRGRGPRPGAARPYAGQAARRAGRGGRPGRLPLRAGHRLDQRHLLPDGRRLDRRLTAPPPDRPPHQHDQGRHTCPRPRHP